MDKKNSAKVICREGDVFLLTTYSKTLCGFLFCLLFQQVSNFSEKFLFC